MKKILCILIFLLPGFISAFAQSDSIPYGNNPQSGHYALVNGIQLYYETYGSGEPLVMLHGNGG